jgi:hypothetical protein
MTTPVMRKRVPAARRCENFRRPRSKPLRGWLLIADMANRCCHCAKAWDKCWCPPSDKRFLWEPLSVQLALRAFALACARVAGYLEPHARAECLAANGFGLRILVDSADVAGEMSILGNSLLAEINLELGKITGPVRHGRRTIFRPLKKLLVRVGSPAQLAALPSYDEWTARPARSVRQIPRIAVDNAVEKSFDEVKDPDLRQLLAAAYASATEAPASEVVPIGARRTDLAQLAELQATQASNVVASVVGTMARRRGRWASEAAALLMGELT